MVRPIPLEFGVHYHVFIRGNNRENLFFEERNYRHFLRLYAKYVLPLVDTYAYCLLPNHFHLLISSGIKTCQVGENLTGRFAGGDQIMTNVSYCTKYPDHDKAQVQRVYRRMVWPVLLLWCLATLGAACARTTETVPPLDAPPCCTEGDDCRHETLNRVRDTDTHVYTFQIVESVTSMSLRLVIETRKGSLEYRLVDPNEEVRWQDRVYAVSSHETRQFEPIVGQWRLEMDTLDLKGGYDVCWEATRGAVLAPPDFEEPASGICAEGQGDVVAVDINADVPSPRCVKVTSQQQIEVHNRTLSAVQLQLGLKRAQVEAGGTYRFGQPVGEFLAPGVHVLLAAPFSGPEVWLVEP
jgi:REP element-mobilizing transposase RayT